MSSPKKRIDILVPCHSYLNKSVQGFVHPPVFLFLFNTKKEVYEKFNITDVGDSEHKAGLGLTNLYLLERRNIHIKFIDTMIADGDEDEYQFRTMEQLKDLKFDYIFPIHCPGKLHEKYLEFLKPTGKLLELDARVEPHFLKTRDEATQSAYRASIIKSRPDYPRVDKADGRQQIEFHEYMTSHEPYVYKEALDHELYYGWYKIYTKANTPSPVVASVNPSKGKRKGTIATGGGGKRKSKKSKRKYKRTGLKSRRSR
jgi:hypothetical protein